MAGTVTVSITGDAASLKRALGDAESSLSSFASKAQSVGERATSIGRSMTLGVTLPLAALGKMAFDELSQAAAASAQTEAAIRSTGGAANVTAKQVDALSQSLLNKSGIDDEVIKSGANVLLTFTGIRNEVGAGNDIFNQATKATLDLSVAFGKDMTSSAIVVGKALQDPIAGVAALRRVGVQLSDSQVELIKNLVATGDTMGAQKVILGELTREVGGSAAAYGDSLAGKASRAKEELKNVSAEIMASALPVLQQLTSIASAAGHALADMPGPVKAGIVAFGGLLAAVGPVSYIFGSLSKLAGGVATVVEGAASAFQTIGIKALYAVDAMKGLSAASIGVGLGMGVALGGVAALLSYMVLGDGAFERAKESAKGWASSTILAAKSTGDEYEALRGKQAALGANVDQLKARMNDLKGGYDASRQSLQAHNAEMQSVADKLLVAESRYDALSPRVKELKQQMEEAKATQEATKQKLSELASGTTDWANATDDAKKALEDINNVMAGNENAALALETANAKLTEATNNYNAALASGDPNAIAEAERNLQGARYDVANATDRAANAQDNYLALINQGPEAIQAEIAKIRDEIATYGDSSGVLQERINKLGSMYNAIVGLPQSWPVDVPVNADPGSVYTLRQELINLTGQPWNVIVNVTSEFDNATGANR